MYTMRHQFKTGIPHDFVVEQAHGLNCRVLSKQTNEFDENPIYTFASDDYSSLKELAEIIYGGELDNSFLMNLIRPHLIDTPQVQNDSSRNF
jgi:hypothetical protein